MANINDYSPQGGSIVGADNQLYNVVDLLGGGTPVDDKLYDITQFQPKSGLVIGSDNRMYDLVGLLKNAGSGSHAAIYPRYGVFLDDTTSTACKRLGDAENMSAANYDADIANDFDKVTPWADMYLCNLDNDGNEVARYGEPGFSFEGSVPPYAYKLPVMVHIPAFWYKVNFLATGREIWISPAEQTGFSIHPAFADESGNRNAECAYIGAKLGATETVDGKTLLTSASGEWPVAGIGRQTFRTYACNRGANWGQADFVTWSALQMLYLVEFSDTDSQKMLGDGISSKRANGSDTAVVAETGTNRIIVSNAAASGRYVGEAVYIGTDLWSHNASKRRIITAIDTYDDSNKSISFDGDAMDIAVGAVIWCAARPSGDADCIGNGSGHAPQDSVLNRCQVAYRGVEGFHGNAFTNIDGCNINNFEWFVCYNPEQYADEVFDADRGYHSIGTCPDAEGYIKSFLASENAPFAMIPGSVGGGSSSYIPDYYWKNTGSRAPRVGGYAHPGAYDGAWSWYASIAASVGNWVFCGRLRYRRPI